MSKRPTGSHTARGRKGRYTLSDRAAGLLLHPTSLPGGFGIGDLGHGARTFVDFLHAAGLRWWQMLPTQPPGPGNSPYSATSAFAGNPALLALEPLVEEGLLARRELPPAPRGHADRVDFRLAVRLKRPALRAAFAEFCASGGAESTAYRLFGESATAWLSDHADYVAIGRSQRGRSWLQWPMGLRTRRAGDLRVARARLAEAIGYETFLQYQFDRQWRTLRAYAHDRGVGLIGDIPIFVAHDSSDVWHQRALFDLRPDGRPQTVSGVPPDLFSRTGQLWGHPHYRWARHVATDFTWWVARFRRLLDHFDAVRIDHFLGFKRVWAVPGGARTAQRGRWVATPGEALFASLRRKLGRLEIIAEDLGLLTPEAAALRDRWGFPGMRLLHFAFGEDDGGRYHQPHAHPRNAVAYPGTHDNDTTVGWFKELRRASRRSRGEPHGSALSAFQRLLRYVGTRGAEIHWDVIRHVFLSPANTAIVPVQDVLGLDERARMNIPATPRGNWAWRLRPGQLTARHAARLRALAEAYDRSRPV